MTHHATVDPETPFGRALVRAFKLARVKPGTVSVHDITVTRNHIEYGEFQRDRLGLSLVDERRAKFVTKRRVIRNPNPRLAKH